MVGMVTMTNLRNSEVKLNFLWDPLGVFMEFTTVIMTGSRIPIPSKVIQYIYTLAFTVEIFFRIGAEWHDGWTCRGEDRAWNCFDLFIVMVAWFEASLGRLGWVRWVTWWVAESGVTCVTLGKLRACDAMKRTSNCWHPSTLQSHPHLKDCRNHDFEIYHWPINPCFGALEIAINHSYTWFKPGKFHGISLGIWRFLWLPSNPLASALGLDRRDPRHHGYPNGQHRRGVEPQSFSDHPPHKTLEAM